VQNEFRLSSRQFENFMKKGLYGFVDLTTRERYRRHALLKQRHLVKASVLSSFPAEK